MAMQRVAAAAATLFSVAQAATLRQTPMERVAQLLQEMKHRIEQDGKTEQQSYDKYACWCEDTMGRKANDIAKDKEVIEEEQARILKLKANLGSNGAEIEQTKRDIAANLEAQRDAAAVRDREHSEYNAERVESEQCAGALEAAVKVLAGAGEKKAFLETMREAQVLSVVAGIRGVVARPAVTKTMPSKDLQAVQRFIQHPEEFMGSRAGGFLSAAQIANNPFGDYAPQSTQIQGILKGMYDTFVGDLEKSNADEAEAQKSHEELMATKKQELETLQATLESQEMDEATRNKELADSRALLDDTKQKLEADEKLFEDVKAGCQLKAEEWSERSSLRTMELQGVTEAIKILTDPDSRATFQSSVTTFVQVSSGRAAEREELTARSNKLAGLARKYHSYGLAQIAVQLKSGGHFDKVIAAIDAMMEVLRKEEQDDIAHRDRCQDAEGKNQNDMEDLNHAMEKADKTITRSKDHAGTLRVDIDTLKDKIRETEAEMQQLLDLRNDDVAEFHKAVKDDTDAIALLEQAIAALTRFYAKNDIALGLISKKQAPEYTIDKDKAPETSWSGGDYTGRKEETGGIVAIVEMIKEDLQKEINAAKKDDAASQAQYEKERGALQETLDAQVALKLAKEKELSEVESKIADTEAHKDAKAADLSAERDLEASLLSDCTWVKTHFESRRDKRKAEMDGLVEAKSYLAGVEAGTEV